MGYSMTLFVDKTAPRRSVYIVRREHYLLMQENNVHTVYINPYSYDYLGDLVTLCRCIYKY